MEKFRLLEIFTQKKEDSINKKYRELIEAEREKDTIIKQFNEIKEEAKQKLEELYVSQFADEDLEKIKVGQTIDASNIVLKRCGEFKVIANCQINGSFKTEKIIKLENERNDKLEELFDFHAIVKAHLEIAENKEEIEEILIRYDILNKKKQLNLKECD